MQYKATSFDTKEINKGKRIAIIKFASYGSLDRDQDMSNKGMFTKSWTESPQDILFFLNHKKELRPGRTQAFDDNRPALWEDDNGAYARLFFGTHTLGDDTLKMMDEGIITNNSFGFDPIKSMPIKDKGKSFKEVKLWEVSVLTHWGAHPDSQVMEVNKAKNGKDYSGSFSIGDEVYVRAGKEHISGHAGVKMTVIDRTGWDYSSCYEVILPNGSRYKWYAGSEIVPADETEADTVDEQMSEAAAETRLKIKQLESYCRNSSVSDEMNKFFQSELKSAQELLSSYDTAATSTRRKPDASVDEKEFAEALTLLTLKM